MHETRPTKTARERLLLLFIPALVILATLLEAFGNLSIPLFSPGMLLLTGGLVIPAFLLGGLSAALLPGQHAGLPRQLLFVATLLAVVCVALDVTVGGHAILSAAAERRAARAAVLGLGATGLFALLWVVRRRVVPVLFVASFALFASSLALNARILTVQMGDRPLPAPEAAASDQPPVLYIVLDGAMGIEGLRRAPDTADLAEELRALLLDHGFRLHGSAFSRHFVSARSIPNTLNFDFRDDSWGPILRHHVDERIRSALFRQLSATGYEIISYATEHLDFCFDVATRCEVLPSFNPFSPYIANAEMRTKWLYQVVWQAFRESYIIYRYASLLSSQHGDAPSPFAALDGYSFPRWFARLEKDVTASPRGRAYFAHLLVPHAPYVLDESCELTGESVVGYFLSEEHGLTGAALERARVDAYRAYERQYRCVQRLLAAFLTHLEELPEFADATIVIHGDHGPRISAGQYAESVSSRDLIDNYSTLYAIRGPGIEPGYDGLQRSVQRLTAEYFVDDGESLGPDSLTVVVDSKEAGQVVIRSMADLSPAK